MWLLTARSLVRAQLGEIFSPHHLAFLTTTTAHLQHANHPIPHASAISLHSQHSRPVTDTSHTSLHRLFLLNSLPAQTVYHYPDTWVSTSIRVFRPFSHCSSLPLLSRRSRIAHHSITAFQNYHQPTNSKIAFLDVESSPSTDLVKAYAVSCLRA